MKSRESEEMNDESKLARSERIQDEVVVAV
jgi:hypothetical protein